MYEYVLVVDGIQEKRGTVQFRPNVITEALEDLSKNVDKNMSSVTIMIKKLHFDYDRRKWC